MKHFVFVLLFLSLGQWVSGYDGSIYTTVGGAGSDLRTFHPNWMQGLPDSMRVSELSIPGTHDTGAEVGNYSNFNPLPAAADCQDAEVYDQLVSGVRFLDLRVTLKPEPPFWKLHHAGYEYRWLSNVLDEITFFLDRYPSETVLCRLSADRDADTYNDAVIFKETYSLMRDNWTKIWQRPGTFRADGVTPTEYADEATGHIINTTNGVINVDELVGNGSYYWPTLGEVRGKMVMFLDPDPLLSEGKGLSSGLSFIPSSQKYGTTWPTNLTSAFRLSTRDDFDEHNLGVKQTGDIGHIGSASTNRSKTFLYATGLNIGFDPPVGWPSTHAEIMNSYLLGWLNSLLAPDFLPKTGIVIMDFPGPAILDAIIARNFRYKASASSVHTDFYQYVRNLPLEDSVYEPLRSEPDVPVLLPRLCRSWRRLVKEQIPSAEFNTYIVQGTAAGNVLKFTSSITTNDTSTLSAITPTYDTFAGALFQSHRLPPGIPSSDVQAHLASIVNNVAYNITNRINPVWIKQKFDVLYPEHEWTAFYLKTPGIPYTGIDFDSNLVHGIWFNWDGFVFEHWLIAGSRRPDLVSTNESNRSVVGHWEFPYPQWTNALIGSNLAPADVTAGAGPDSIWLPRGTPGIRMSTGSLPNGGPSAIRLHQWSLVMDVWPSDLGGGYTSLIQIDSLDNSTDGDVFIKSPGGIGISGQYFGAVSRSRYQRVVVAVDATQEQLMSLYIDGNKVGEVATRTFKATGDVISGYNYSDVDRWSLQDQAILFGDNNGESGGLLVSGIQLRNYKMSDAEVARLGGVSNSMDRIPNDDKKVFIDFADRPELQVANTNGFQRMVNVSNQVRLTWKPGDVLRSANTITGNFSDVTGAGISDVPGEVPKGIFYPTESGTKVFRVE